MSIEILDHKVTVCANCLQASCWHGILMCERAREVGTVERTVGRLRFLDRESPDYWFRDPGTGMVDEGKVHEVYCFDRRAIVEWNECDDDSTADGGEKHGT